MPYLNKQEIEQIAARVVRAYCQLPLFEGQQVYKIDPDILLRVLLGLTVQYYNIVSEDVILDLTATDDVEICIQDENGVLQYRHIDGKTVVIDNALRLQGQTGHLNFTLAHEASHQIFKMLFPKEYRVAPQIHYCRRNAGSRPIDWEEWRTDALAAAILMPPDLIADYLRRFGFGARIRMLNRVYARGEYLRFTLMADALGVSKTALAIRLNELGLIEHNYFTNPHDLVNIRADKDWEE